MEGIFKRKKGKLAEDGRKQPPLPLPLERAREIWELVTKAETIANEMRSSLAKRAWFSTLGLLMPKICQLRGNLRRDDDWEILQRAHYLVSRNPQRLCPLEDCPRDHGEVSFETSDPYLGLMQIRGYLNMVLGISLSEREYY